MNCATRRRCCGLTLIEVLVALTIFATLGVLCYRAIDVAVTSQQRIEAELLRWQAIGRGMQRLQNSLQSIVAIPQGNGPEVPSLVLSGAGGATTELQFLRLDKRLGLRRQAFRLADGRLYLLGWSGRKVLGEPGVELLFENVRGLHWGFLKGGARLADWPPVGGSPRDLPDAISIEIDLADVGVISRQILLRW